MFLFFSFSILQVSWSLTWLYITIFTICAYVASPFFTRFQRYGHDEGSGRCSYVCLFFYSGLVNIYRHWGVDLEHGWRFSGIWAFPTLGLLSETFHFVSQSVFHFYYKRRLLCQKHPPHSSPTGILLLYNSGITVSAWAHWRTLRCIHDDGGYVLVRYRELCISIVTFGV
jgi:hypothetical protein